jgi:hypothetical protein
MRKYTISTYINVRKHLPMYLFYANKKGKHNKFCQILYPNQNFVPLIHLQSKLLVHLCLLYYPEL